MMKRVKNKNGFIRLVKDDDIVQHILCKDSVYSSASNNSKKSKAKRELEYKINKKKSHYEESLCENEMEESIGGLGLLSPMQVNDPDDLYGRDMFKFKTSKKAGQMAVKAQTASPLATPGRKATTCNTESPLAGKHTCDSPAGLKRTPSRRSKPGTESPTAGLTGTSSRRSKTGPLTPIPQRLSGPAQRDHERAELSTPYRLRRRNVAVVGYGEDVSGSDDSMESSEEEEEEKEEEMNARGGMKENNLGSRTSSKETDLIASAESYFDVHSMNPVTSDRTLASLDTPRMDIAAIQQVLKGLKPSHVTETSSLLESHQSLFDRWMLNMCQGYNILTYGLGSKLSLLESFRQSHLKSFSHLVVNGYFPSLTVKHILNSITEEILEDSRSFTNIFAHIEFIEEYFKSNDEDFYLVIHNIDGVLLRSKKCQNHLSLLAAIPGVHVVASVDHINASFLWDEIQFFRFHWLWYDTTTFLSYQAENSYENSLMVQQSGGLALSSLVHVMRSLTPNAKRIFLTLAEYQLEASSTGGNYEGMSFQALYQKCREDFLVNSDLTLQAQLVEFKDHRLIRAKKNFEGIEHLLIPIDKTTLKTFLEEQKENKS